MDKSILKQGFIFYRNIVLSKILGYFEYLFLSNAVFIGLIFFAFSVLTVCNENALISKKIGYGLTVFGNVFFITTPGRFINVLIGFLIFIAPIFGYLFALLFRKKRKNVTFATRSMFVLIVYAVLILLNFIVFKIYNRSFELGYLALLVVFSIFGLILYAFSSVLNYLKNEFVENVDVT